MTSMVRTHVMLPEVLVEELDAVVEPRRRSAFIESAIREKLLREKQRAALRRSGGALKASNDAVWSSDPTTWVRSLREQDEAARHTSPTRPTRLAPRTRPARAAR